MLRSEAALMIYPADAAIPDDLIPLISVAELSNRGKTELVEVTLTLKGSLNAEDFAPQAKRLLGDFARVTPLEATNQLIIRAPVGNILRHLETLTGRDVQGVVAKTGPGDETEISAKNWSHKCVYVRANIAEEVLRKSLGNLTQVIVNKGAGASANPMEKEKEKDGGKGPLGGGGQTSTRTRVTTIASDKGTNTVFVSGPADKIEQAKLVIAKIDVGRPGRQGNPDRPVYLQDSRSAARQCRNDGQDDRRHLQGRIDPHPGESAVAASGLRRPADPS